MLEALEDAKLKAGGATGLASLLSASCPENKITPQAVSQWTRVPASRVIDVERITGVSRHVLRPDIFGSVSPAEAGGA